MNIVHVLTGLSRKIRIPPVGYGGIERYIYYIGKEQSKEHNVLVLNAYEKEEIFRYENYEVRNICYSFKPGLYPDRKYYLHTWKFYGLVNKLLKDRAVDIINLYNYPPTCIRLSKKAKYVLSVMVSNIGIPLQKTRIGRVKERIGAKFDAKFVFSKMDAITFISNKIRQQALDYFDIEPEKTHVVGIGVDSSLYRPIDIETDERTILCVSKYAPVKGLEYLMAALKKVKNCRLIFVHPKTRKSKYVETVTSLEKGLNVEHHSDVSDEELIRLINKAQLFVLPSIREAFGIVFVEAMACGLPVIGCRNSGGPDDFIVDGYNGFLVESRNTDALADKIQYLLDNPSTANEMGKNARKFVEEKYSWESIWMQMEKVYNEVLRK